MFKFKFKEINFFSGNFLEIKKQFDKGGVLVAPAASALTDINKNKHYYKALKNADIAILDSGFFCILLRVFKKYGQFLISAIFYHLAYIVKKDLNFKGNIDIEITNNNDYIVCRLTDNGPGITDAKKAMTPYFTTKKTGTGLGLPIVSKIINEHSGNFIIQRLKKGNGTLTLISLPKFDA